ncbi:hypothetical protein BH11PLA2_BH11PLA2_43880 [soil metagenome]
MAAAGGGSGGGSASAVRAGRCFVEIFGDDKQFIATLDGLKGKFTGWGKRLGIVGTAIGAAGAAITGPLIALFTKAVNKGGELNDLAARLGTTTEEISALGYAAEQGGAGMDVLEKSVSKMRENISKGGIVAGFDLASLNGKDVETQFLALSDHIDSLATADDKIAASRGFFGKGGTALLPTIKGGAAAVKQLTDEAREFGLAYSQMDSDKADKIGDAFSLMWRKIKGIGGAIGKAILPFADDLEFIAKTVAKVAGGIGKFIKENQRLIMIAFAVGSALVVIGTAIAGMGLALAAVSAGIAGFVAAWGAVSAVFAAVISPIGLIIAGIVATTAAVGYLLYKFTVIGEVFEKVWGGIVASVLKGDLKGAFNIIVLGINVVWAEAMVSLTQGWNTFNRFFVDSWRKAAEDFTDIWETAQNGYAHGWLETLKTVGYYTAQEAEDIRKQLNDMAKDDQKNRTAERFTDVGARTAKMTASEMEAQERAKAAQAELEAAIARANAVEEKAKDVAKDISIAATAAVNFGSVKGAFGANLNAGSLSFGESKNIAKNTEETAKNTAATNKILAGKQEAVWDD